MNKLIRPDKIFEKAKRSAFYLFLLNQGLGRMIPFNSPHKFTIVNIGTSSLKIAIPYIRKNKNHINGIHACALATLCEYISGLCLARAFPPEKFRIILKEIHMEYHYQAKMKVLAEFSIEPSAIHEIKTLLEKESSVFKSYTVRVYDEANNFICTGSITWQIKPWDKVKATL